MWQRSRPPGQGRSAPTVCGRARRTVDPTLSFSAIYEVEAGGYEDAEAALERVCAGEVDGYSCGGEPGPTFDGDGVLADGFESPDEQPFGVILSDGGDGSDAPSFLFTFTGGGFPEE